MMRMGCGFVLSILLAMSTTSEAKDVNRNVGTWIVSHRIDNMDDTLRDAALTPDTEENYALALRCFSKTPEAFIFVGKNGDKFEDKDGFKVKFRADQGTPQDLEGTPNSDGSLELSKPVDIIRAAQSGTKLAFRFAGNNASFTTDVVFQTARNREALSDVVKNCGIGAGNS